MKETDWNFASSQVPHFMNVVIFFKVFLDNKMSIFEEYGAFKSRNFYIGQNSVRRYWYLGQLCQGFTLSSPAGIDFPPPRWSVRTILYTAGSKNVRSCGLVPRPGPPCLKDIEIRKSRPRDYKTFFMLNSAEHEICPANKSQLTNNGKSFLVKHS